MAISRSTTVALAAIALSVSLAPSAAAQAPVTLTSPTPLSTVPGTVNQAVPGTSTVPGMVTQSPTPQSIGQTASNAVKAIAVPVTGNVTTGGALTGTLGLTSFASQNGQVLAVGTLSAVLTSTARAGTSVITNVVLPVTMGQTSCQTLNLTLGPTTVSVAGLSVDLGQVVFEPTAMPGTATTLGTLLCGMAGQAGNPGALAGSLNQVLAALSTGQM